MEAGACYCDYEPCEVYSEKKLRARKLYHCDECGEEISPGTEYVRVKALSDGRWTLAKRCVPCQSIARDYCCGIVDPGMIREVVQEEFGVDLLTGEIMDDWSDDE
jgi:hypothetical protein